MHIGIVVNPRARRARDPQLAERLQALCDASARAGGAHGTVAVVGGDGPDAVERVLASLLHKGIDVLAPCGGDGTLMTVMSALGRQRAAAAGARDLRGAPLPALLILPGGTMNTTARNLGLGRLRPAHPARTLAEGLLGWALAAGRTRKGLAGLPRFPQELLHVTTIDEAPFDRAQPLGGVPAQPAGGGPALRADGLSVERCGFLFGAAMGARFLAAYASGARPGPARATWLALRTIGSSLIPGGGRFARWLFGRVPAELLVDTGDGAGLRRAPLSLFRLFLASTIPDVGLGMQVPWRAGYVPQRFQLVASDLGIGQNVRQLGRILRGRPLTGQPHLDALAVRARLQFTSRQPFTLDGDLFTAAAVELRLGPQLDVLGPPG